MNKIINNKKGFTLIELLAVIIILSIVALIAVPNIKSVIDDSKEVTAKRSIDLFVKSFKQTASESALNGTMIHNGFFTTTDGHTFVDQVSEKTLNVSYNGNTVKCDDVELYSDGNMYLSGCVVGDYELTDYTYGAKKICIRVNSSQFGNIPEGNYDYGDGYICNVGDDLYYNFFLLEEGNNSVSFIMDRNYTDSTVHSTLSCDNNVLNTYVQHIKDTFTKIDLVTLPTKQQIVAANGGSDSSLPIWLCDYLSGKPNSVSGVQGYWTSSLDEHSDTSHYAVISNYLGVYTTNNDFYHGIRPVITISKDLID